MAYILLIYLPSASICSGKCCKDKNKHVHVRRWVLLLTGSARLTLALIFWVAAAQETLTCHCYTMFTSMAVKQQFRQAGGRPTFTCTSMHTGPAHLTLQQRQSHIAPSSVCMCLDSVGWSHFQMKVILLVPKGGTVQHRQCTVCCLVTHAVCYSCCITVLWLCFILQGKPPSSHCSIHADLLLLQAPASATRPLAN